MVVLTADPRSSEQARATFGASEQIELRVGVGHAAAVDDSFEVEGATVVVIDLDASLAEEMQALRAPDGAHRRLAAGRRRHPGLRRERGARAWCRCGSPTSW